MKRLLFCGVGCQVQGMVSGMHLLDYIFKSLHTMTHSVVMQSDFLSCSIEISGAASES